MDGPGIGRRKTFTYSQKQTKLTMCQSDLFYVFLTRSEFIRESDAECLPWKKGNEIQITGRKRQKMLENDASSIESAPPTPELGDN